MEQRKRIAIYGGTFDPVHRAHLEIARRVTELFEIDEFLFVPARVAPHKVDRGVSMCGWQFVNARSFLQTLRHRGDSEQ